MTTKNNETASFISAIKLLEAGYQNINFCYLAIKTSDGFHLIQGRIYLNTAATDLDSKVFCTENILAGQRSLSSLNTNIYSLVEQILSGSIKTPEGNLLFPGHSDDKFSIYHNPFHPEGLQAQQRLNVLTIQGAHISTFMKQPFLDWEVMAAETPFHDLQALANEYGVGLLRTDNINIDIAAWPVAVISGRDSIITDTKAKLTLLLAEGLQTDSAAIGYNVISQNKIVERKRFNGKDLKWSIVDKVNHGSIEIDVPKGSLLHCFAIYSNLSQHRYWVSDPATVLNPNKAVYETFDSKLATLQEIIAGAQGRGQNARDFEAAVAWLLWMLGFNTSQLGNIPRMQDGPDLIAITPKGNYVVLECTTGLLKADNKLPTLHDRARAVHRSLEQSGNIGYNVLPVMVTSKTRSEVEPELEQAERHGILVLTREDLEEIIKNHLITPPNAEKIYNDALQAVHNAQAKYKEKEAAFTTA